jgi:hypothetical protein
MEKRMTINSACCVLVLALLVGCSKTGTTDKGVEAPVRQVFEEFGTALKTKDAAKMWALLDPDTQAEATKMAQEIQEHYVKASKEQQAEWDTNLGLTSAEVSGMTGQGIVRTKRFLGKYEEIPESKIQNVVIKGEVANVHYLEPDGDKAILVVKHKEGKWKVAPDLPKYNLP